MTLRPCTVSNCPHPVKASGYCNGHLLQYYRGKNFTPVRMRRSVPEECSVADCTARARTFSSGSGLCPRHHSRWMRHGDPLVLTRDRVLKTGLSAIASALESRDRSSCWRNWDCLPCWEGLGPYGGKLTRGHPILGSRPVAHLVLEAEGRPRPPRPDNYAVHLCGVSLCWNPDHLRWGSRPGPWKYCDHCPHCNPGLSCP